MKRPGSFDPPWIDFFTKPCPYFMKQLTTFPRFSRLPRELQLMIWANVIPERRVIQLIGPDSAQTSLPPNTAPGTFILCLRYSIPEILHTCYDARVAGLKIYKKAFFQYVRETIYFDFDRDYLELDVRTVKHFAEKSEYGNVPLLEPPKVKNLAITSGRPIRGEDLVLYCQFFTGLERLAINEQSLSSSPSTDPLIHMQNSAPMVPHTFQPDQNSFRHNWDKLRAPIMKRVPFVRPALKEWKPPLLIIGTETQWEQHSKQMVDMVPVWGGVDPNSMDWESTVIIPSLEYVPRLETVSSRGVGLSIGKDILRNGLEYAHSDEREHHDTKSRLFYREPVTTNDMLETFEDDLLSLR